MSDKKIQRRAVVVLAEIICPVCGKHQVFSGLHETERPHFIINRADYGVIVSLTCPACVKPIQVYIAGESYTQLKDLEKQGEYEK